MGVGGGKSEVLAGVGKSGGLEWDGDSVQRVGYIRKGWCKG